MSFKSVKVIRSARFSRTTDGDSFTVHNITVVMLVNKLQRLVRLVSFVACILNIASLPGIAEERTKFCATGLIELGSFSEHIERLRQSKRYPSAAIDDLIARERRGGRDFFSSQIIVKEEQSGSGDYDLSLFHGHQDPHTHYKNLTAWQCEHDDYPVVYFVGFKVIEVRGDAIVVSHQSGVVNVISLKNVDPTLDRHINVIESRSQSVLCEDVARGCFPRIFYGRW